MSQKKKILGKKLVTALDFITSEYKNKVVKGKLDWVDDYVNFSEKKAFLSSVIKEVEKKCTPEQIVNILVKNVKGLDRKKIQKIAKNHKVKGSSMIPSGRERFKNPKGPIETGTFRIQVTDEESQALGLKNNSPYTYPRSRGAIKFIHPNPNGRQGFYKYNILGGEENYDKKGVIVCGTLQDDVLNSNKRQSEYENKNVSVGWETMFIKYMFNFGSEPKFKTNVTWDNDLIVKDIKGKKEQYGQLNMAPSSFIQLEEFKKGQMFMTTNNFPMQTFHRNLQYYLKLCNGKPVLVEGKTPIGFPIYEYSERGGLYNFSNIVGFAFFETSGLIKPFKKSPYGYRVLMRTNGQGIDLNGTNLGDFTTQMWINEHGDIAGSNTRINLKGVHLIYANDQKDREEGMYKEDYDPIGELVMSKMNIKTGVNFPPGVTIQQQWKIFNKIPIFKEIKVSNQPREVKYELTGYWRYISQLDRKEGHNCVVRRSTMTPFLNKQYYEFIKSNEKTLRDYIVNFIQYASYKKGEGLGDLPDDVITKLFRDHYYAIKVKDQSRVITEMFEGSMGFQILIHEKKDLYGEYIILGKNNDVVAGRIYKNVDAGYSDSQVISNDVIDVKNVEQFWAKSKAYDLSEIEYEVYTLISKSLLFDSQRMEQWKEMKKTEYEQKVEKEINMKMQTGMFKTEYYIKTDSGKFKGNAESYIRSERTKIRKKYEESLNFDAETFIREKDMRSNLDKIMNTIAYFIDFQRTDIHMYYGIEMIRSNAYRRLIQIQRFGTENIDFGEFAVRKDKSELRLDLNSIHKGIILEECFFDNKYLQNDMAIFTTVLANKIDKWGFMLQRDGMREPPESYKPFDKFYRENVETPLFRLVGFLKDWFASDNGLNWWENNKHVMQMVNEIINADQLSQTKYKVAQAIERGRATDNINKSLIRPALGKDDDKLYELKKAYNETQNNIGTAKARGNMLHEIARYMMNQILMGFSYWYWIYVYKQLKTLLRFNPNNHNSDSLTTVIHSIAQGCLASAWHEKGWNNKKLKSSKYLWDYEAQIFKEEAPKAFKKVFGSKFNANVQFMEDADDLQQGWSRRTQSQFQESKIDEELYNHINSREVSVLNKTLRTFEKPYEFSEEEKEDIEPARPRTTVGIVLNDEEMKRKANVPPEAGDDWDLKKDGIMEKFIAEAESDGVITNQEILKLVTKQLNWGDQIPDKDYRRLIGELLIASGKLVKPGGWSEHSIFFLLVELVFHFSDYGVEGAKKKKAGEPWFTLIPGADPTGMKDGCKVLRKKFPEAFRFWMATKVPKHPEEGYKMSPKANAIWMNFAKYVQHLIYKKYAKYQGDMSFGDTLIPKWGRYKGQPFKNFINLSL